MPSAIRRRALLGAVLLALVAPLAGAQTYPSKPVRVIVPFPPGQAADIFARMLADHLSKAWGQSIAVENRAGGGGIPGVMAGKQAVPDGYTWLIGTSGTLGVNPNIYRKIPYDPLADFAPASNIFIAPLVLVAHPGFAPKTVQELVAAAKAQPGVLNWASAGTGTAQHLTGELFLYQAQIQLQHVPYKGSGPAMTDLLAGTVPLMFDSLAAALPHLKSARIRAIAVTTTKRVPQLPEVPSIGESGYPGFEGVGWSGVVMPAGTPKAIVDRVSADIRKALTDSPLKDAIIERGGIPDPRTPEEYAAFIKAEVAKWGDVARRANVRLD